jgi:hypothetical protein
MIAEKVVHSGSGLRGSLSRRPSNESSHCLTLRWAVHAPIFERLAEKQRVTKAINRP